MYDAAGRRVVVQLQLREDQDPGRGHLGVCDDLEGHTHAVTCAVQLADGRVSSSSYVGTIKIWDARSGACVMTLNEHNSEQYLLYSWQMGGCAAAATTRRSRKGT